MRQKTLALYIRLSKEDMMWGFPLKRGKQQHYQPEDASL